MAARIAFRGHRGMVAFGFDLRAVCALGVVIGSVMLATAYAACTATGGLGRFTLGLDPALACTDAEALRRVTALDLDALSTAGDVIVSGQFAPG
ncbi:MAG: hypothetical protein ACK4XK_11655, partial [Casimicrobiaceae bacterium]